MSVRLCRVTLRVVVVVSLGSAVSRDCRESVCVMLCLRVLGTVCLSLCVRGGGAACPWASVRVCEAPRRSVSGVLRRCRRKMRASPGLLPENSGAAL